jgi:hypothetical protein
LYANCLPNNRYKHFIGLWCDVVIYVHKYKFMQIIVGFDIFVFFLQKLQILQRALENDIFMTWHFAYLSRSSSTLVFVHNYFTKLSSNSLQRQVQWCNSISIRLIRNEMKKMNWAFVSSNVTQFYAYKKWYDWLS